MKALFTHSSRAASATKFTAFAALGAATLALFSANAAASTAASAPTYEVHFADLDLTSKQDTQRLYSRLRIAAREVCGDFAERKSPVMRDRYKGCMNQALTDAIETIGNPALTALHVAKTDMKLAQRTTGATARS
jgi:UrcA family protein